MKDDRSIWRAQEKSLSALIRDWLRAYIAGGHFEGMCDYMIESEISLYIKVTAALTNEKRLKLSLKFSNIVRTTDQLSLARDVEWQPIKAIIRHWRNEADLPSDKMIKHLKRSYSIPSPRACFQLMFIPLNQYMTILILIDIQPQKGYAE